jgi:hypothetical protein
MSSVQPSLQFIPAQWLELACWNRPMIVYSRTIPDPQPRWLLSVSPTPQNCKAPISTQKRAAA